MGYRMTGAGREKREERDLAGDEAQRMSRSCANLAEENFFCQRSKAVKRPLGFNANERIGR